MIDIQETERVPVWSEVEWDASVHAYIMPDGQEMIFFHLDTYLMTPRVLKDMIKAWKVFRYANRMPLFTMGAVDTPAHRRLVEMFGFRFFRTMPCTDGKTRNLYIHHYDSSNGAPKEQ